MIKMADLRSEFILRLRTNDFIYFTIQQRHQSSLKTIARKARELPEIDTEA